MSLSLQSSRWIIVSSVVLLTLATTADVFGQRVPQPAAPQVPGARQPAADPTASANPRQANPGAQANPRGTARGDNTAAGNAPTIVGQVVAYDADKSITVEVKRRGGQATQSQFNLVKEKSHIELLGDTKEIAKGMTVSVWADKDDAKLAARITAGTAAARVRGQANPATPANPGRVRTPNPANPGNVRTPNPDGATPNLRGQANPANPAPNPGRRNPQN